MLRLRQNHSRITPLPLLLDFPNLPILLGSRDSGRSAIAQLSCKRAGAAWASAVRHWPTHNPWIGARIARRAVPRPLTSLMVDYNLINSLGDLDADVDAAVA